MIELSIVMVIAGFIMSGVLQYYTIQMQKQRYETTKKNLAAIHDALTVYAATYHRLPCPSSPLSLVDAPKLTMGRDVVADAKDEKFDACSSDATMPRGLKVIDGPDSGGEAFTQQIVSGILPMSALRLNADQTRDGWGNLYTYAVARKLTVPDSMHGNPPGVISVQDGTSKSLLNPAKTGRYVVISHGPSGKGAWTPSGGQIPCGKGTLDAQNCDGDTVYVIAPYSTAHGIHFFDDFVIHDESDAAGTLIDKLVLCNSKKKFYAPGEMGSDPDGCKAPENQWQGACLLPQTLAPDGKKFVPHPPIAVMTPAIADGNKCGCSEGYTIREIGTWDDKLRSPNGVYNPWSKVSEGQQVDPAINEIMKMQDGSTASRNSLDWYTRTALYTCVAQ